MRLRKALFVLRTMTMTTTTTTTTTTMTRGKVKGRRGKKTFEEQTVGSPQVLKITAMCFAGASSVSQLRRSLCVLSVSCVCGCEVDEARGCFSGCPLRDSLFLFRQPTILLSFRREEVVMEDQQPLGLNEHHKQELVDFMRFCRY
ncbi:unnamed protein product, partial [Notodromas monacha]